MCVNFGPGWVWSSATWCPCLSFPHFEKEYIYIYTIYINNYYIYILNLTVCIYCIYILYSRFCNDLKLAAEDSWLRALTNLVKTTRATGWIALQITCALHPRRSLFHNSQRPAQWCLAPNSLLRKTMAPHVRPPTLPWDRKEESDSFRNMWHALHHLVFWKSKHLVEHVPRTAVTTTFTKNTPKSVQERTNVQGPGTDSFPLSRFFSPSWSQSSQRSLARWLKTCVPILREDGLLSTWSGRGSLGFSFFHWLDFIFIFQLIAAYVEDFSGCRVVHDLCQAVHNLCTHPTHCNPSG